MKAPSTGVQPTKSQQGTSRSTLIMGAGNGTVPARKITNYPSQKLIPKAKP